MKRNSFTILLLLLAVACVPSSKKEAPSSDSSPDGADTVQGQLTKVEPKPMIQTGPQLLNSFSVATGVNKNWRDPRANNPLGLATEIPAPLDIYNQIVAKMPSPKNNSADNIGAFTTISTLNLAGSFCGAYLHAQGKNTSFWNNLNNSQPGLDWDDNWSPANKITVRNNLLDDLTPGDSASFSGMRSDLEAQIDSIFTNQYNQDGLVANPLVISSGNEDRNRKLTHYACVVLLSSAFHTTF